MNFAQFAASCVDAEAINNTDNVKKHGTVIRPIVKFVIVFFVYFVANIVLALLFEGIRISVTVVTEIVGKCFNLLVAQTFGLTSALLSDCGLYAVITVAGFCWLLLCDCCQVRCQIACASQGKRKNNSCPKSLRGRKRLHADIQTPHSISILNICPTFSSGRLSCTFSCRKGRVFSVGRYRQVAVVAQNRFAPMSVVHGCDVPAATLGFFIYIVRKTSLSRK